MDPYLARKYWSVIFITSAGDRENSSCLKELAWIAGMLLLLALQVVASSSDLL